MFSIDDGADPLCIEAYRTEKLTVIPNKHIAFDRTAICGFKLKTPNNILYNNKDGEEEELPIQSDTIYLIPYEIHRIVK